MNNTTWTIYREYLEKTGSEAAAASLTLADIMQTAADRPTAPDGPLTVPEVAKLLRVRTNKVLAWVRAGELRGYDVAARRGGRPRYRVNVEDLNSFAQRRATMKPATTGRPAGSRRRIPVIAKPQL